jgi:hypothetical protein
LGEPGAFEIDFGLQYGCFGIVEVPARHCSDFDMLCDPFAMHLQRVDESLLDRDTLGVGRAQVGLGPVQRDRGGTQHGWVAQAEIHLLL